MTVYVEHTPAGTDPAVTVAWARLWADTIAEAQDFAARLEVAWPLGAQSVVVTEGKRRRAILMGAIPVHTDPHQPGRRGELSGVAA